MRYQRCDDWKTYKKPRGKAEIALRHPVFSYSMGDTLISPIVASYLLYLAVTYTLIRTYLDKPDNLHFNGDYRKKLNCSHYYLGMTERTISSTQSTPSVSLKKQTPLLGKGCLLLFVIHYLNNALQRYNSFLKLQTNSQFPVAI